MNTARLYSQCAILLTVLGTSSTVWPKDGVLSKVQAADTSYCHLHFAAMNESTLSSSQPLLKDASSGDIIHFYGPCDYDPHGKEAVQSQLRDLQRRFQREYNH